MKIVKKVYGDPRYLEFYHQSNLDLGPSPHHLVPGQIVKMPVKPAEPPKPPDARLTWLRNSVEAYTPERHAGHKNEGLNRGHRVSTLAASSAEVTFFDESRLQLGEHTLVVILGDGLETNSKSKSASASDTTLLNGTLRAHLSELGGSKKPLPVTTPAARVMMEPGESQIAVDDKKSTRLAVYHGRSKMRASGKEVAVKEGFGSRADEGKAPTTPRPLPLAPEWSRRPPTILLAAPGPVDASGDYRVPAAPSETQKGAEAPPPALWHVQLAHDDRFNDLIVDAKVGAEKTTLALKQLQPGRYFARVSGIDADQFEGAFGQAVEVQVVEGKLTPPASPEQGGRLDVPDGIYCGVDGGALAMTRGGIALPPGKAHSVRCSTEDKGAGAVETAVVVPPPPGVKFAEEMRAGHIESGLATQDVLFRLKDGNGDPLLGAKVVATADHGASASPVVDGSEPGAYLATVSWPPGPDPIHVHLDVNGGAGSRDIELPAQSAPVMAPPLPVATEQLQPRVVGEVGIMGVLRDDDRFGRAALGPGFAFEGGLRVRLGAAAGVIAAALRAGYDHYDDASTHDILSMALPITYRFRAPEKLWTPYLGVVPQLFWENTPEYTNVQTRMLAREAGRRLKYAVGGIAGIQVNAGPGGLFLEIGYEHRFGQEPEKGDVPAGGVTAALGYRFRFGE